MILFDKIYSTGIDYCVVAQSPYHSINMSVDNKGGEMGIFIIFFLLLQNTCKFLRSGNIILFWAHLGAVIRIRTFSSLDHLSAIEIQVKLQFY